MKIQSVKRCGVGIEVKVDNVNYYFNLSDVTTQANLKTKLLAEINKGDSFDTTKFDDLKKVVGATI